MRFYKATIIFLSLSVLLLNSCSQLPKDIHDNDNAYYQIKSLVERLNLHEPDDLPSFYTSSRKSNIIFLRQYEDSKTVEEAEKYIKSYPTLLKDLKPILESRQFRFPEVNKSQTGPDFDVEPIFEISRFLDYSTNLNAFKGNKKAALETAIANLKYTNLILKFDNKNSLSWLVAMTVGPGKTLQNAITTQNFSDKQLLMLRDLLPTKEQYVAKMKIAAKTEYDTIIKELNQERLEKFKAETKTNTDEEKLLLSKLDPVMIRKEFDKTFERLVSGFSFESEPPKNLKEHMKENIEKLTKKELNELAAIFALNGLYGIRERTLTSLTSIEATRITIACKRFELKYGKLPENLNQLVPEFLKEVPKDPFDCKTFRYDSQRKIVYSVGENLVDSGGKTWHLIKREKKVERKEAKAREDILFYLEKEYKKR